MEFIDAANKWYELGHTTVRWENDKDGCFYVLFVKNGNVVGQYKTIPGQGVYWEWPDELLNSLP